MSVLTRLQIRTLARNLGLDPSSTNSAITDAEINSMIDEVTQFVWNFFGPRYELVNTTNAVADGALTITAQGEYRMTTAGTTYDEIAGLHYEGATSDTTDGPLLEQVDYQTILELRRGSVVAGTPRYWHGERIATTPSGAAGAAWVLMVHPPPAAVVAAQKYFSARVRFEMTAYASDASTPDVLPVESYYIARMVGWEIAAAGNRGADALDVIARLLPEELRAARGIKLHAAIGVASVDMG